MAMIGIMDFVQRFNTLQVYKDSSDELIKVKLAAQAVRSSSMFQISTSPVVHLQ
jgi:hypothetical protein